MTKLAAHFMDSSSDGHLYDCRRPDWREKPLRLNYSRFDRQLTNGSIALRAAVRQAYAWPGGYDLIFVTSDGACLCTKCVRKNYRLVSDSRRKEINDGWRVIAVDASCNSDEETLCDNCGAVLIEGPYYD
jgi:hypothetical protein